MKDNMKRAPFSTQIDLSKFDMKDFAKASDEEKRQSADSIILYVPIQAIQSLPTLSTTLHPYPATYTQDL